MNKPMDEEKKKSLKVEHNVRLMLIEIVAIFNVLNNREYKAADGVIIMEILNKLEPFLPKPPAPSSKEEEEPVILTKKEN